MKQSAIFFLIISLLLISCKEEKQALPTINVVPHQKISWEEKLPCTIEYSDRNETVALPGEIKFRGGMSSRYHKHSFSLELDKKFSMAGLPRDDDWILNADYIDKTLMRHNISYDLFREMHDENVAAQSAYLHLSVDSVYEGLYLVMEELNGGMIGLDKKDTMAMLFKDPPIFFREKLSAVQDSTNYYQQKFPKIEKRDRSSYLTQFRNFMFDSSDEVFATEISNWVDIRNVVDWHIMLLFSNNDDGVSKNFYLYKLNANTPFRFAIWDYDHSYGRDADNERNMMERPVNIDRAVLLTRLMAIPETDYIPRLKKRWFELRRQGVISIEHFEEQIQKNDAIIRDEVERNFDRWPVDEDWYYDANTYSEELDLMREFVELRIPQLDRYFQDLRYE